MAQFSRTTSQIDAILDDVVSAKGESETLTAEVASKTTIEGVYGVGSAIALNSDLDDITEAGVYYSDSATTSASLSNCPHTSSIFHMFVYIPYGVNVHQFLFPVSAGGNGYFYKRLKTTNGWTSWTKISSYGLGTSIAASTDLNTITMPGMYYCNSATTAAGLSHCPVSTLFHMEVKCTTGSARYLQEITTAADAPTVYRRLYTSNGWQSWYKFEGTVVS